MANDLKLSTIATELCFGGRNGDEMDIDDRPFKRESGSDKKPGFPIKSIRYSLSWLKRTKQEAAPTALQYLHPLTIRQGRLIESARVLNSNARWEQRPTDNFPIGSKTEAELILRNPTESLHRGANSCSSVDATHLYGHNAGEASCYFLGVGTAPRDVNRGANLLPQVIVGHLIYENDLNG